MIIVSSCLAGARCRYDGSDSCVDWVVSLVNQGLAVSLCPEQLGGLSTPRPPAEIQCKGGVKKVVNQKGCDVTETFLSGADKTLQIVKILNASVAILKSKSPSCGFGSIYSGNFDGVIVKGNGVTAEKLYRHGITIFNEYQYQVYQEFCRKVL